MSRTNTDAQGAVLAAIGGVYAAQGLVGGITLQGMPAVLRASGAELGQIGLMSLAILPWALKFLWAPALERARLPAGGGPRRTRAIVLTCQAGMLALLLALAAHGQPSVPALLLMLSLLAVLASSADIACDAYAVEQLQPARRGWGNAAQVGGSYLGMFAGAGLFLLLRAQYGWTVALAGMAALLLLLSLPFTRAPEPMARPAQAHRPSLAAAWRRPQVRGGLLITVLFQSGSRLVMTLSGPLLLDRGVALSTVGWLSGAGGVAAGLAGTGLGVWLQGHCRNALPLGLALQALGLAAIAAAVLAGGGAMLLMALLLVQTALAAAGFVVLYAYLMGQASPLQAGVDFTLFQCADAAIAALAGVTGAALAQALGYGPGYVFAAAWTLAACCALPRVARHFSQGDLV
ncbi:MFS transporter [Bordetella genomosp. 12]|uniref:MFS transporter n=1 Tax=Bordetella genomosp. 12 TaxID=463035 RepID=UPI0011782DD7|nr:MFS transporter [Bordetella genomosp. 12]